MFSLVLGLINFKFSTFRQKQIFQQLYLIELLVLLTGMRLLKLYHLIYPKVLTGFGMQFFFRNISLMELWFWMGSLDKNIQLMLEILKAPCMALLFSDVH